MNAPCSNSKTNKISMATTQSQEQITECYAIESYKNVNKIYELSPKCLL